MPSVQTAINKYNRKCTAAAWSAGVTRPGAAQEYASGLQRFWGVAPPIMVQNWSTGVSDPAAAQAYAAKTSNGGQRWYERTRAKMAAMGGGGFSVGPFG